MRNFDVRHLPGFVLQILDFVCALKFVKLWLRSSDTVFENRFKKSHSALRVKRATFTLLKNTRIGPF